MPRWHQLFFRPFSATPMSYFGRETSFIDVQATMLGRPLATLQAISCKESTERKMVMGNSATAIAYADGATKYEGSISVLQSELRALARSAKAKGRKITRLPPFDIVVMHIPDEENPVLSKDVIKNVLLEEFELSEKVGDMEMTVALKFKASDVDFEAA